MEVPRYWDEVWGPSEFDLTAMYWLSPLADPDDFVTNTYATTAAVNVHQGGTKEMDDLMLAAKSAATIEERKALYRQQQELSLEMMDVIPLDANLVRGSHGRVTDAQEDGPLFLSSTPELVPEGAVGATDVKRLILDHVFGGSRAGHESLQEAG